MKKIFLATAVVLLAISAIAIKKSKGIARPGSAEGFAVVELFTSEGCSSCPPADALIAKLQRESEGKPIFILAYHVDYWNRLGWTDMFSSHEFSERQSQYANWLQSNEVYTPQAIVNGTTQFVGSDENALQSAVTKGLSQSQSDHVVLSGVKFNGSQVIVDYAVSGSNGGQLLLAVVQKQGATDVKRGENSGRRLSHVQIVRTLKAVNVSSNGSNTAKLDIPADAKGKALEIIAFLQNPDNGAITGAAKTTIPQPAGVAVL